MPRLMYDSTDPLAIPTHAQMVLVYVDGKYQWSQAGRDRFKHAKQVTCSAIGAVSAQVGDVEFGCIWPPANAVPWVQRARRDGYDPTVYVNEMNDWGPVREAFRAAGEPEPHWWVANYNGVREIPAGSIGRQYAHPSDPPGNPTGPWHTNGHWDESWVADYWPGVDDVSLSGDGGAKELEMSGVFLRRGADTGRCFIVEISTQVRAKWHIPNTEILEVISTLTKLKAEDVPDWTLDYIGNSDGPPPIPVDVDEDALAAAVSEGVIPAVVRALQDLPTEGLSVEETVEAVREAMRTGAGVR
jgi:hypothetical protein